MLIVSLIVVGSLAVYLFIASMVFTILESRWGEYDDRVIFGSLLWPALPVGIVVVSIVIGFVRSGVSAGEWLMHWHRGRKLPRAKVEKSSR